MGLPFRVMLISDRSLMGPDPVTRALELTGAGIPGWALQWRDPIATSRELYRDLLALEVAISSRRARSTLQTDSNEIARASFGADEGPVLPLFVNDRADIALALRIHIHLKESSIPTRVARAMLPGGSWVGRSVHTLDGAITAAEEGADYVLFGPIFDTPSKRSFGPAQGVDALRTVANGVSIPVIAVGGIDAGSAAGCIAAGATGVAVIRAVWEATDPLDAIRTLLHATE